jgi:hypothetical protein
VRTRQLEGELHARLSGQHRRRGNGLHAGYGLQPIGDLANDGIDSRRGRESGADERGFQSEDVLGIESGVHREKLGETCQQESGSQEKDGGQGNFEAYEKTLEPAGGGAHGGSARLPQHVGRIDAPRL